MRTRSRKSHIAQLEDQCVFARSLAPLGMTRWECHDCRLPLNARRTAKEAAPIRDCLFVNCALRYLELLDHPDVPEPPQVIIEAARIADGIAKLK